MVSIKDSVQFAIKALPSSRQFQLRWNVLLVVFGPLLHPPPTGVAKIIVNKNLFHPAFHPAFHLAFHQDNGNPTPMDICWWFGHPRTPHNRRWVVASHEEE
jgi:hypothetical protein